MSYWEEIRYGWEDTLDELRLMSQKDKGKLLIKMVLTALIIITVIKGVIYFDQNVKVCKICYKDGTCDINLKYSQAKEIYENDIAKMRVSGYNTIKTLECVY